MVLAAREVEGDGGETRQIRKPIADRLGQKVAVPDTRAAKATKTVEKWTEVVKKGKRERPVKSQVNILVEVEKDKTKGNGYVYQARLTETDGTDASMSAAIPAQQHLRELWKALTVNNPVPQLRKVTKTGEGRYYIEPANGKRRGR